MVKLPGTDGRLRYTGPCPGAAVPEGPWGIVSLEMTGRESVPGSGAPEPCCSGSRGCGFCAAPGAAENRLITAATVSSAGHGNTRLGWPASLRLLEPLASLDMVLSRSPSRLGKKLLISSNPNRGRKLQGPDAATARLSLTIQ